MSEIEYIISTHPSKAEGYQSKKGLRGKIKVFVSNIWNKTEKWALENQHDPFQLFVDYINLTFICERYCLERAFQKIKIKGGMCNPCCIRHLTDNTVEYLFGLTFDDEVAT